MAAINTANSREGEKSPNIPFKEDGEFYDYIMYHENNRYIAYADSPAELIDILIRGYEEMTESDRLNARLRMALSLQSSTQAQIFLDLSKEQKESLKEWEIKAIQGRYNETDPWAIRDFWKEQLPEGMTEEEVDEDDRIDIWSSEIPLVLIDASYAPWTDIYPPLANPEGTNIIWLKPMDEVEFLESLNSIDYIAFGDKRTAR